jgi:hypothetical protein
MAGISENRHRLFYYVGQSTHGRLAGYRWKIIVFQAHRGIATNEGSESSVKYLLGVFIREGYC